MVGLIVAILVLFQISRALTPYLSKTGGIRLSVSTQDTLHRWNGKLVLFAGFANVFLGLNQIRAPVWYFAGGGAIVAAFFGFVGILELWKRRRKKERTRTVPVLPIHNLVEEEEVEKG